MGHEPDQVTREIEQELAEVGVPDRPATWENEVDGLAKEVVGHLLSDRPLVEQGQEEIEIAHEVRDEYRREHPGHHRSIPGAESGGGALEGAAPDE